jgi:hypothetical protein
MPKLNGLPWVSVAVDDDDALRMIYRAFDEAGVSFQYEEKHGELMLSPGNCHIQFYSPTFIEQGWG